MSPPSSVFKTEARKETSIKKAENSVVSNLPDLVNFSVRNDWYPEFRYVHSVTLILVGRRSPV
jgi:hypothetical protein